MKTSTYQELNKTLKELCRERDKIQDQIDDNHLSINEAQRLSKEILDKEDEDFKVFSPRKIADLHKAELDQFNIAKINLEKQNDQLTIERDKLNKIINVIQMVIDESKENEDKISNIDNEESENKEDSKDVNNGDQNAEDSNEDNNENSSEQSEKNNNVDSDSIPEQIKMFKHKVELCSKFIAQDPARAKRELEMLSRNMDKMLLKLEDVSREKQ